MRKLADQYELIEPFIEHQGERRGFWLRKPRAIGEKILIARKGRPVPGRNGNRTIVFLDFKSAFGTGGHGTTEGCLVALQMAIKGGETVLDVGTGTGILAIAARKLGSGPVRAIDISRAACIEAGRNIACNGIAGGIDVTLGGMESVEDRFDIVIANLRTPLLLELLDRLIDKLNRRGIAIFSGILERELHPFLSALGRHPVKTLGMERINGWMTLTSAKVDDPLP